MSPAARLTLMRVIPIIVLVAVAMIAQQAFGLDRIWAALLGLASAFAVRIAFMRSAAK